MLVTLGVYRLAVLVDGTRANGRQAGWVVADRSQRTPLDQPCRSSNVQYSNLPFLSMLCMCVCREERHNKPLQKLPSLRDSLFRNAIRASGRDGFQVASTRDGSGTAELGHTYSKRLPNRDCVAEGSVCDDSFSPHLAPARWPTDWTCRWAGCQAGRCWRSHALPRLQVRSSQTKLNLQLCSYLLHTPDLGTLPTTPQNKTTPRQHPTRAFFALPPVPSRNLPFFFSLSLFLRHRARRRAIRLLRDDSAKACGFLPSPWRTLRCPWRQRSSSGTVSPPTNSPFRPVPQ